MSIEKKKLVRTEELPPERFSDHDELCLVAVAIASDEKLILRLSIRIKSGRNSFNAALNEGYLTANRLHNREIAYATFTVDTTDSENQAVTHQQVHKDYLEKGFEDFLFEHSTAVLPSIILEMLQ